MTQYQAKCQELQATEINLRSQISLYTDKYDEFQNALTRSNEVFGGFKGEMEKVSWTFCVFLQFACCIFKELVYSYDHRYMTVSESYNVYAQQDTSCHVCFLLFNDFQYCKTAEHKKCFILFCSFYLKHSTEYFMHRA